MEKLFADILAEIKAMLQASPHLIKFKLAFGVDRELTDDELDTLMRLVTELLVEHRPFIEMVTTHNLFPDPKGQLRVIIEARYSVNVSGFGPAPI